MMFTEKEFAGCIDHTLLNPAATKEQIEKLCGEAIEYGFATVFVNSRWLSFAWEQLRNSGVKLGGVVSFPYGADTTEIKVAQAKDAIFCGADEVDMVADLAAIIECDRRYLANQISSVLKVCKEMRPAVCLKVIIEAPVLTRDQKIFVCDIADSCGVDFVKTSTGTHSSGGAALDDVRLMKEYAPHCKVKASGGIRTAQQALEFLEAGADRIGTSASVQIMNEFRSQQG